MMEGPNRDIVSTLQTEMGDGLRSVGHYTKDGYEVFYLRPDVEAQYTRDDIEDIHQDLILEGLSKDRFEDLFRAGPLECSMHGFEDALMFHFVGSENSDLFVGVDSDAPIDLSSFIGRCKEGVETV
ncbi:hypothetical protein [Haladaptatus sp. NG-SE-30]